MTQFRRLKKKITAAATAAVLGVSLVFGAPAPVAEADGLGTILQIGGVLLKGEALKQQKKAYVKQFNETKEGQAAVYADFEKSCGVDTNPVYTERLDRIMGHLVRGVAAVDSTINDLPYRYFVANTDDVNAFCAMGHVMIVNRGMFNFVTNEDELAAIIGHELGHGQKNHVAKGYENTV